MITTYDYKIKWGFVCRCLDAAVEDLANDDSPTAQAARVHMDALSCDIEMQWSHAQTAPMVSVAYEDAKMILAMLKSINHSTNELLQGKLPWVQGIVRANLKELRASTGFIGQALSELLAKEA